MKRFALHYRLLLVLLGLLAGQAARAQAPAWQQVQPLDDFGIGATVVAANGTVYVAGTLTRWSRGLIGYGETGPPSTGHNAFVGKWDAARHRFVWLIEMGKQGHDGANALVVQGSRVYVAGSLGEESEGFGHPLKLIGSGDLFITRLTDHGTRATVDWTRTIGYPQCEMQTSHLACDGAALYVAGTVESASTVDAATGLWGRPITRTFVARLHDTGRSCALDWQRTWLPDNDSHTLTALVAQQGRLYLAENTKQYIAVDSGIPDEYANGSLIMYHDYRLRLTCLRDQGTTYQPAWTWATAGYAHHLAVAGAALYLVGFEDYTAPFGGPPLPAYLPRQGNALLVAKLGLTDSSARLAWVRRLPGTGYNESNALCYVAVRERRVYVAGTFGTPHLTLGRLRLHNAKPDATREQDLFVAQLTDTGATGRFDWAERVGGAEHDWLGTFALAGSRLYLSGLFQGDKDSPVWLGRQRFPLPADANNQAVLQAWRPLGNPVRKARKPATHPAH